MLRDAKVGKTVNSVSHRDGRRKECRKTGSALARQHSLRVPRSGTCKPSEIASTTEWHLQTIRDCGSAALEASGGLSGASTTEWKIFAYFCSGHFIIEIALN